MGETAYASFRKGDLKLASEQYMKAIALAEPNDAPASSLFKGSLAEIYRQMAVKTAYAKKAATSVEDLMEAQRICAIARGLDPSKAAVLDKMNAEFQDKISLLKYRAVHLYETNPPDFKPLREKLDIYLAQGRAFMLAGEFAEAKKIFEKGLELDQNNIELAQALAGADAKVAGVGRIAGQSKGLMTPVQKLKAPPRSVQPWEEPSSATDASLRGTVISKLDLRGVSLQAAFSALESAASTSNLKLKFLFVGFDPASGDWPAQTFVASDLSFADAAYSLCEANRLYAATGADGLVCVFKKP
jgi:tetratricopeptide (TPR) repeat protein